MDISNNDLKCIEDKSQNVKLESSRPLSPLVIIRTQNFRTYRKPKEKRDDFTANVWPKTEWFISNFDRKMAEIVLKSAKSGTFLIRKSSEIGFYAMSIAFNENIYHCLIENYSNGFGFDSTRIFSSLEELVSHYKNFESLVVHNKILETRLMFPVFNQEESNLLDTSSGVEQLEDKTDERIIGGRLANLGECPYQIALHANGKFMCGGFLVRPNAVVTAAHCIYGSPKSTTYAIRYNTLNHNSGPSITVSKATHHPNYNKRTVSNDVAVLHLSSSFVSGRNAQIVDISKAFDPSPNSVVMVSGWGRTSPASNAVSSSLKVGNLTVISRQSCAQKWVKSVQITNGMVCAMGTKTSSCNGDSGGPLVQNGTIIGIVSFGTASCNDPNLPNVYTLVSYYRNWINEQLAN